MSRTDTRAASTFNLPFPNAATFRFETSSPLPPSSNIHITVPEYSTWHMPYHWHPSEDQEAVCRKVTCLSGFLRVSIAHGLRSRDEFGSAGRIVTFRPGQRVAFYRDESGPDDALTVILETDHVLWRNICSAVLDRDIFPELISTPLWLKALFTLLPFWRNALLGLILHVQLRTIFAYHGVHLYHGYIPVTWPWIAQPFGGRPPAWAQRAQLQSVYLIARVVMTISYAIGVSLLGMRGQYDEYTPNTIHVDEKSQILCQPS